MRAILVLIGLAGLVLVALMSVGMVSIKTTPGQWPTIQGGEAPTVKADVGSIDLTTTERTIAVPKIEVHKAPDPAHSPSPAAGQ